MIKTIMHMFLLQTIKAFMIGIPLSRKIGLKLGSVTDGRCCPTQGQDTNGLKEFIELL